ncbi:ADP-ribosylglycohydrolase family protein [Paenibacillus oralis]|uniref:ADP-ribosylglycohydrolase family protein n=2 Tax=Paenibacillus oralis TaxID=2490856 RepID=A0A3P3TBW4_9BACL|nr:ADP-ribosylglycohydrolase family protein [Paenibacillus oralis]
MDEYLDAQETVSENFPRIHPTFSDQILGAVVGSCVGDALGVPAEFKSRDALSAKSIEGMTGFGTWNQPEGTWSDDSSMSLCTLEALVDGYSLTSIAGRFLMWYREGYWTPYGNVFDIGNTTKMALDNLSTVPSPELAGLYDEYSNGNGSLMRILPISFITYKMPFEKRIQIISEVSSITHAHRRSIIACIILVEFASNLLCGNDRFMSYKMMQDTIKEHFGSEMEVTHFPLVYTDISRLPADFIRSGGYVVDTLEAAFWCVLNYHSYREVVLSAVNLGGDTDTTGCVAGGLAGLAFGFENIPPEWVNVLARMDEIKDLTHQFLNSLDS